MQFIGGEEIHRLLDFQSLVAALRAMFREGCEVPARHHHAIGEATLLVMPAWQEGAVTSALDAIGRLHQRALAAGAAA